MVASSNSNFRLFFFHFKCPICRELSSLEFSKLRNVQIYWHGTSTQTERLKGLIHNCGRHFTSPQNWSGMDLGAQWIRFIPVVDNIYPAPDITDSNSASVNGYNTHSKRSLKRRMYGIFGSLPSLHAVEPIMYHSKTAQKLHWISKYQIQSGLLL